MPHKSQHRQEMHRQEMLLFYAWDRFSQPGDCGKQTAVMSVPQYANRSAQLSVVFAGLNDFVRTIYIRGTKKVVGREISLLKL
jgi:hypothetical protein